MSDEIILYICPVCFRTGETREECHEHIMVECRLGKPGDDRRKPVEDPQGRIVSRAPRWFLEAIGRIKNPD